MLEVGSLFAGIGGLERGLEATGGFRTTWQVERDPFARSVLEHHWPACRRWDDVRTFPGWPAEVVVGGFPCQDVSKAGQRAGLAGARSGLWREFARIVGVVRPRYVVVENVAALLGRGLETVLGDMAALGYDAEWDCIPAASVGAPHLRDRIFIIAYPDSYGDGCDAGWLDVPEMHAGEREPGGVVGQLRPDVSDANGLRRDSGLRHVQTRKSDASRRSQEERSQWATEPDVGRVAHGVPARVDRIRCLGNAVVPQVAQVIGRRILMIEAARKGA